MLATLRQCSRCLEAVRSLFQSLAPSVSWSVAPPLAAASVCVVVVIGWMCLGLALGGRVSWCKRAKANVAEVLHDRVNGLEGVAVFPVGAWFAPGPAGVPAKCKVFGDLVAHGCLGGGCLDSGRLAVDAVVGPWKLSYVAAGGWKLIASIKGWFVGLKMKGLMMNC